MAYYRSEIRHTSYFKAHFNLARLLAKRRHFKEAERHYTLAALRTRERFVRSDAWNNLGVLYTTLSWPAKAVKAAS
jgi:hypothetical protein